jgi:catechol 2,3-dioxygenase-like lactoylglutathione lyase family enzyme
MLDHLSIGVKDMERSLQFYDAVLKPLGIIRYMKINQAVGYGANKPQFWVGCRSNMPSHPDASGFHIAFQAKNRAAVDEFYQVAIALGGISNGEPGLRPNYHPSYYAAFIIDPNGYHLEAVCHKAE